MDDQNRIGDKPIDERHENVMRALATGIDKILNGDVNPPKLGFILMVYEFGPATGDSRCNYVSNSKRDDVMELLREQLAHFERQMRTAREQ